MRALRWGSLRILMSAGKNRSVSLYVHAFVHLHERKWWQLTTLLARKSSPKIIFNLDMLAIRQTKGMSGAEEAGSPEHHGEKTKRLVHFSSGETMWECSSEEEEEEELLVQQIDPATLPWRPFLWFWMTHFAHKSLLVCDFLGEKVANLLGLTTSKYQYAVDEYFSAQDQEDEDGDGGAVAEMEEMELNERKHLPLQTLEYGTLTMSEGLRINSKVECKHEVSHVNEVLEESAEGAPR
ncbi:protein FAM177B-like [Narcine bancroftii]|uniref:protein FAM177B-like n=1 Tax=Narcine bancroftii TaxID=1343680 RepID=UPI003831FC21